jgi:hypothetical protein
MMTPIWSAAPMKKEPTRYGLLKSPKAKTEVRKCLRLKPL